MGTTAVRKIVTGVLVVAGFLGTAGVGVSEAAPARDGGVSATAGHTMVSDATKSRHDDERWE
ncbi:hypothetical protein ABZ924_30785 [Streptomyces sp. NPDC046876]|uniref:hypothetical protein n=1 Tax=Streptomyces sp. NPDC046876 TaxID=3155616 RepID=UPI0033F24EC4